VRGERRAILIVGSVNLDQVVNVVHPPLPGETVIGTKLLITAGGKGGNQAVAAARLGGRVRLAGCIGRDEAGMQLRKALRAAGVDDLFLLSVDNDPTGLAIVTVSADGESSIVVVPGANRSITTGQVRDAAADYAAAVVVAQLEVPLDAVAAAAEVASANAARFVLNAAPWRPLSPELLMNADPLVVNEHEAATQLDTERPRDVSEALAMAAELARQARSAVITLGSAGAVWAADSRAGHVPASPVAAVDTTGAGDALVGALAYQLAAGFELSQATTYAVQVASMTVTRRGAQASFPTAAELEGAEPVMDLPVRRRAAGDFTA
jgi:ribokinase